MKDNPERVNKKSLWRRGPSIVIRIKNDTYQSLGEIAQGFENPDDVIRRLIKLHKGIDEEGQ